MLKLFIALTAILLITSSILGCSPGINQNKNGTQKSVQENQKFESQEECQKETVCKQCDFAMCDVDCGKDWENGWFCRTK